MTATTLVYIALGLMFVLPALIAIWVGIQGSEWFFKSSSYRFLQERLGWRLARVAMVALGLLLIAAVALVLIDPLKIMK